MRRRGSGGLNTRRAGRRLVKHLGDGRQETLRLGGMAKEDLRFATGRSRTHPRAAMRFAGSVAGPPSFSRRRGPSPVLCALAGLASPIKLQGGTSLGKDKDRWSGLHGIAALSLPRSLNSLRSSGSGLGGHPVKAFHLG
jgi:hypothetical protein